MPKKVMILTPFYDQVGGAETFAEELFKETRKVHNAWVCTISWRGIWRGTNWWHAAMVVFDLFCYAFVDCFNRRPNTIHALGFNAAFVAAILKPIFRFRLIVTPLSLYDWGNKLLYNMVRWTLRRADLVFAESEISKTNLCVVTDYDKIKIFTHWVDTKKFHPIKRNNEKLKVLFAGRMLKEKGAHIIKQVEWHMKGVEFIYAQDIPNSEMPHLFQMADLLVVPSLYAESPNRVVAEGAACGCVVITSDKGALPEQVREFGFSVEPRVEEFMKAISAIDKDRLWLQLLRDETIEYAKKYLTEKNAERIINEY